MNYEKVFAEVMHLALVILGFVDDSLLCTRRGWGHGSLKQIGKVHKKSLQLNQKPAVHFD